MSRCVQMYRATTLVSTDEKVHCFPLLEMVLRDKVLGAACSSFLFAFSIAYLTEAVLPRAAARAAGKVVQRVSSLQEYGQSMELSEYVPI